MKKKFIVWGHKLHSHTTSYVLYGYLIAFKYLGYDVYHFDESDDVSNFDFSDCLFLTEGQVDKNIPIRKDSRYILHNCDAEKYIDAGVDYLNLQVYNVDSDNNRYSNTIKIDDFVYYHSSDNTLDQPWATNLLPHEVETELIITRNKTSCFVGMVWAGVHGNISEITSYAESCTKHGYLHEDYPPGSMSFEQNRKLIADSEIAPTVVGVWQKEHKYIPCRIFKNISYGKLGMTNSETVRDVMEGNIVYDNDPACLVDKYLSTSTELQKQMFRDSAKLVAEEHTYINRIENILFILNNR